MKGKTLITALIMTLMFGGIAGGENTNQGQQNKEWILGIKKRLKSSNAEQRKFLIKELGKNTEPEAISTLSEIIVDDAEDIPTRRIAIESLSRTGDPKKVVPVLLKAYQNENLKVVSAYNLSRIGQRGASFQFLIQYAENGHPEVLFYNDKSQKRIYFDRETGRKILLKLIDGDNDYIRAKAALFLSEDFNEVNKSIKTALDIGNNTKLEGNERIYALSYVIPVLEKDASQDSIDTLIIIMSRENSELLTGSAEKSLEKLNQNHLIGKDKANKMQKKYLK
ncbi:MAG TPA: hypothetical protein DEE98_01075 [Elusimicrobia bacterium]|nr:MAG: hypothetical protein A2278_03675 [Elusimicrobia bacterium RIFOXYA12_FULL_49_49]OGS15657.1 MAG: hypothetical protein A2251_03930 [Elusimicrobia bacterium RIFOXYA2_FULL_47_53]OGS26787.1 MAG: hypothetical protein A2339_07050 [Elusimicrobia bacterium RIFOXYB12_FULL_50_12]OGS30756.1 MAG: hypothetical protein A2323_07735 [Elusimicrobia bacterium RIFOXYB2_FULL_46_23]HBU68957.1 hypothetical protein [Elusimicrobiota bacterium]